MSEVKRYSMVPDWGIPQGSADLQEDDDGDYVESDDYDAAVEKIEALKRALSEASECITLALGMTRNEAELREAMVVIRAALAAVEGEKR